MLLMAFAAILEMLGIGALLPIIGVMQSPARCREVTRRWLISYGGRSCPRFSV